MIWLFILIEEWLRDIFNIKIPSMPIIAAVKTIPEILSELGPQWQVIDGLYFLPITEINTIQKMFNVNLNSGLVLKTFINTSTGEIKTYIAKMLDIPERQALI